MGTAEFFAAARFIAVFAVFAVLRSHFSADHDDDEQQRPGLEKLYKQTCCL